MKILKGCIPGTVIILVFTSFYVGTSVSLRPTDRRLSTSQKAAVSAPNNQSDDIVRFPEEEHRPLAPSIDKSGKPYCALNNSLAFCEDVPDYPTNEIIGALSKLSGDALDIVFSVGIKGKTPLNTEDLTEEAICSSETRTFKPKAGKTLSEDWVYVVNNIRYEQLVTAEICRDEGKPCNHIQGNLPSGFQSVCRQRFAFKSLLAIKPVSQEPYKEDFRFPSCCICYVTTAPGFRKLPVTRTPSVVPDE